MQTHELAVRFLEIYGHGARKADRRRLLADCAKRAIAGSDDRPEQPRLDYREWRRDWDWSMPIMIGSGRRSEWCHAAYRWRAHVALMLHRDLGWSGERVRKIATWLSNRHGDPGGWALPASIPDAIQVSQADRLYRQASAEQLSFHQHAIRSFMRESPCDSTLAIVAADWDLWLSAIFQPSWGREELAREVYRMEHGSGARASSYATSSIRSWCGDKAATDFSGCSGCEWIAALHERQDLWGFFVERSDACVPGKLGDLDAVLAPHGARVPEDFDYCAVFSLNSAIHVRKSEFEEHRRTRPTDLVWHSRFEATP